jgi:YHS domain-containing protein
MKIQFFRTVAIASLLTLSAIACSPSTTVDPDVGENLGTVDPCAGVHPCAAADSDGGAKVEEATNQQPYVYSFDGLAIRGADPVAYFTEGEAVKGVADYEYQWNGATWRFSSAENLAQFTANPDTYAPQYGGYCAKAVAEGYLASIDPDAWRIVDGKLYLNYSPGVQRQWQSDISGHIASGDQHWPTVLAVDVIHESGNPW